MRVVVFGFWVAGVCRFQGREGVVKTWVVCFVVNSLYTYEEAKLPDVKEKEGMESRKTSSDKVSII